VENLISGKLFVVVLLPIVFRIANPIPIPLLIAGNDRVVIRIRIAIRIIAEKLSEQHQKQFLIHIHKIENEEKYYLVCSIKVF
jgi:hypothetical protein